MKIITLIFFLFILLNCGHKNQQNWTNQKPILKEDKDYLIGKWKIFVAGYGGDTDEYCLECPQVIFKTNGTGTVTHPSGATEQIEWIRDKSKLNIKNISVDSKHGKFNDGEYSIAFQNENDSTQLELVQPETSYHLHLFFLAESSASDFTRKIELISVPIKIFYK